jgi:hypothetical protein
VILPFIWIFNPQLLLIDVHGGFDLLLVVGASLLAMLIFAAITMNWFRVRTRWWENALLALAVVLLFRPDMFMDALTPEYRDAPAAQVFERAQAARADDRLVMVIKGQTIEGDAKVKTVALNLGAANPNGRQRLQAAGLQLVPLGDQLQIGAVRFGSPAQKSGFQQGWDVATLKLPTDRPSPHWFYLPALLIVAAVWWLQGRRLPRAASA